MVDELERIYTVPLRDAYKTVKTKRTSRAAKILKSFLARHMKTQVERVKISGEVNSLLWTKGMEKPPRRIKVKVKRDAKGDVTVTLIEEPKQEKSVKSEEKKG